MPPEDKKPDTLDWAANRLKLLSKQGFYGKVVLSFEQGRITMLRREENEKPPAGAVR